jgi:hypothetical protein
MSLIRGGRLGLYNNRSDGGSTGNFPGYTRQLAQKFVVSKGAISLTFHPALACSWTSATFNGAQFLRPSPHGQGNCAGLVLNETVMNKDNYAPSFGARFAPTEPGRSSDGGGYYNGSSHLLYVGVDDLIAPTAVVRVQNIAHWWDPDSTTSNVSRASRTLSDFILEQYDTIVDDNTIHRRTTFYLPNYAEARLMSYVMAYVSTHYANYSQFNVFKRINPSTGGLTLVTPVDGNTLLASETEPYLVETADLSIGVSVYYPISQLVPGGDCSRGFMGCRFSSTAGHANVFGQFGFPKIDPNTFWGSSFTRDAWIFVGPEATVASKVAAQFVSNP